MITRTTTKLLVVIPKSPPFLALAAYAQSSLSDAFATVDVVTHGIRKWRSDFELRRRRIGLLRALDEHFYCLAEAYLTPWEKATERLGHTPYHDSFHTVASLLDPAFEDFVKSGSYDVLVGLGCEYIAIEKMPGSITALNIHPGILPYYKGVGNPEAWLRGDFGRMGVTIHRMTQRIDDGPIICQRSIAGMKRLNIPLSYLVAYKAGIDMLAVAVGKPHVGSSAPSETPKPARVILWRMRISLFIIGTLKTILLRSNALLLHEDAHATNLT